MITLCRPTNRKIANSQAVSRRRYSRFVSGVARNSLKQVAKNVRVSTTHQAAADHSILNREAHVDAYLLKKGWQIVGCYVDTGATRTDDSQPAS